MRLSIATTATPNRSTHVLIMIGVAGCMLALAVGGLAATHYGVLVGSVIVGLAFFAVAIAAYVRDPILALIGLWLFEVFNAPVSSMFGYFSTTGEAIRQGNEVLVLLFVFLTVWRALRTSVRMPPSQFLFPGIGVALFGFLGAIIHSVPLKVSLVGALLGLKLWIILAVSLLLPWKPRDLARIYSTLVAVGLVVAAVGFGDYLTHGAVSRALHTSNSTVLEGSYRSEAVHSIFPTPGEYSLFMSLLFALTFARFTQRYSKVDLMLALLFAGSVILSLRLKGFLSLAAVVSIIGVAQGAVNYRRAMIASLVGALLVVGAYSVEKNVVAKQFSTYASSETTARGRLYSAGGQIAASNFPLGVGFGRFASYASRLYYSPVYYEYKLSRVFGLSSAYPKFIDDTSWPSVIGEAGYGGFVIYAGGLIMLIVAAIRRLRAATAETKWLPLAALCAIAVLLVDSLGSASLFSWVATTTLAMILAPMLIVTRLGPVGVDGEKTDETGLRSIAQQL